MTQLSFVDIFEQVAFDQKTSHLPAAIEEAIGYFRSLIERYNAAILSGDFERTQALND